MEERHSSHIVVEVARPERRQSDVTVLSVELDRLLLVQPDREQRGGVIRISNSAQINGVAKNRPVLVDGSKVGIFGIGKLTACHKSTTHVLV